MSSHGRDSAVGVVAVVLIVAVLWVATQRNTQDVLVFGDSLSFQATTEIENALEQRGLSGRVISESGARIGDAEPWIGDEVNLLRRPKVVVLALGTNDALLDPEQFRAEWPTIASDIDAVLDRADGAGCVVWVAPAVPRGAEQAQQVVDRVRQTAPDVHIVDWPTISRQFGDVHAADGVHHTDAGRLRFAAAIVNDGVQGLCGTEAED